MSLVSRGSARRLRPGARDRSRWVPQRAFLCNLQAVDGQNFLLEKTMQELKMKATRRLALQISVAALSWPLARNALSRTAQPTVEIWKSPECGCCKDWVDHLEANGFETKIHDTGNASMRAQLGIPQKFGSCHTARVDGYALEGHVPAADIRRLLQGRPVAVGLAVPGMPVGSPGMDGPAYRGRRDLYDVLLIGKDGKAKVFGAPGESPSAGR